MLMHYMETKFFYCKTYIHILITPLSVIIKRSSYNFCKLKFYFKNVIYCKIV